MHDYASFYFFFVITYKLGVRNTFTSFRRIAEFLLGNHIAEWPVLLLA
uniref:Uncharacterized protein n=1 Tax=Arundo donax TaxID=35708 RepID=A0A0A8ZZQ5_ARUDO